MGSANSLDLNKSPSSNGKEDLQKEFNSDNELMKISNEPEEDGMIMSPSLSFLTVINCSICHSPLKIYTLLVIFVPRKFVWLMLAQV